MMERISVLVEASDPISRAGITAQLKGRPEVRVIEDEDNADVGLVVADDVDDETLRVSRALQRRGCQRVVHVLSRVDDGGLVAAIEAGSFGLIRRTDATVDALVAAVTAAASGDGTMPPDLLGRLLARMRSLQQHALAPRGLTLSGLTQREIEVLKLVAEGFSTSEIALRMSYSERTIKNVIHDVTMRLQLRNRSQAVAYAMKEGLI
jgi:DNA-binding NarL/FixJ family response regulator